MRLRRRTRRAVSRKRRQATGAEVLETRTLLSRVTAELVGGDLQLSGDDLDNDLVGTLNGGLVIEGQNDTLINGQPQYFLNEEQLSALNTITFWGNDGNDTLSFTGVPSNLNIGLNADLGFGDDALRLTQTYFGSVFGRGSHGDDEFSVQNTQLPWGANIMSGPGSDEVTFREVSAFPDSGPTVSIKTGDDDDTVVVAGVNTSGSVTVQTGDGADTVSIDTVQTQGLTNVSSGLDDDAVLLIRLAVDGPVRINGGDGDDFLQIRQTQSDDLSVNLDDGNDELVIESILTDNDVKVRGNSGSKMITGTGVETGDDFVVRTDGPTMVDVDNLLILDDGTLRAPDLTIKIDDSDFGEDLTIRADDGDLNGELDGLGIADDLRIRNKRGNTSILTGACVDPQKPTGLFIGDDFLITAPNGAGNYELDSIQVVNDFLLKGDEGPNSIMLNGEIGDDATLRAGDHDDVFNLQFLRIGDRLNVQAGDGNNTVDGNEVEVDGRTRITTGDDDDVLTLDEITAANVNIASGDGTNAVDVDSSFIRQFELKGGDNSDSVRLTDSVFGDLELGLGDGDNEGLFEAFEVIDDASIQVNDGFDEFEFLNSLFNNLEADVGDGNDIVRVENTEVRGQTEFDLGDGNNVFEAINNTILRRWTNIFGGSGNDLIRLDLAWLNDGSLIDTDGGNDIIQIDDSFLDDFFTLNAGSGNDIVTVDRFDNGLPTVFVRPIINLGSGDDELELGFPNRPGNSVGAVDIPDTFDFFASGGKDDDTVDVFDEDQDLPVFTEEELRQAIELFNDDVVFDEDSIGLVSERFGVLTPLPPIRGTYFFDEFESFR